jgi:DNA repair protein RecN (Recombination protein N)
MLLELRAENYAVIDQAVASFGPGLNLLTGETGAGKSILIDALALLLGGKASPDVVRHGAEKAVLGCVFESTPGAVAILDANGIDAGAFSDDILLQREIAAGGKGRVFVNNQPATVAVLRELAPELGLIHTQGETLGSFDQAQQRGLLDRFGGLTTDDVAAAFVAWRTTTERLAELQASEQDRMRMADLWRFQAREIADAQLAAEDEDAQLEAEKRVLANAEKLYTAAKTAHELLYESEGAAQTTLTAALKHVEELAKFDARFAEPAAQLAAAKAAVEDVSAQVRDFAEKVHASPERLEEIEDRLAALDRLKRKYGGTAGSQTLAEVMRFGEEAARRLAEVENRDELLAELKVQLERDEKGYRAAAEKLTAARRAAAARLERLATAEINDLAMTARFRVQVTAEQDFGGRGDVSRAAGAEGDGGGELCRRSGAWQEKECAAYAANAGLRRDRHWDWRAGGGGGGAEAEDAGKAAAGGVHHAPAADCCVCRPAFSDREGRTRRTDAYQRAPDGGGRARTGDRADAFGGEADGDEPGARAEPAEVEPVGAAHSSRETKAR